MQKKFGLFLLATATLAVVFSGYSLRHLNYYLKQPFEKLIITWSEDVKNLERSKSLPKEWSDIKEFEIKGDNSWPTQDWITQIKKKDTRKTTNTVLIPPIKLNSSGRFKLEIFLIHWIEGYRYGAIVQYHLVEIATKNTVWELDRTYKMGFIY